MDQHLALGIFLELAFQRGSLSHILESVLLLLRLWDRGQDNEKNSACTTAPLNSLLKRLERFSASKCQPQVPRIPEEVCKCITDLFIYITFGFLNVNSLIVTS